MAIREILQKLMNGRGFSKEFSARDGLTPDEVELNWYKRKEYLANVKRELKKRRENEKKQIWKGSPMNDKHQIIKAKNVFKDEKKIFTK